MTTARRIVQLLLLCGSCFLLPCVGQMISYSYSGSSAITSISNFQDCATVSCWHSTKHSGFQGLQWAPGLSLNGATPAATLVLIDDTNHAQTYADYPANAFTAQTAWGTVYAIQNDSTGTPLALVTDSSCPANSYRFKYWTGSAWALRNNICLSMFSQAASNSQYLAGVDSSGSIHISSDDGNTWATGINNILWVSVLAPHMYAYVKASDGTVQFNNSGTVTQLPTLSYPATQVSINLSGTIYAMDSRGENYHFNGTTWDTIFGSAFKSMASGGAMSVFALSGGDGLLQRFSEWGIRHTRTLTGSATCAGNNCMGAYHTASTQAGWGTNYGQQQNSGQFSPMTPLNLPSSNDLNDPFLCLEGAEACVPTSVDQISCSQDGQIYNWNGATSSPPSVETNVISQVRYTSTQTCYPTGGILGLWHCNYNVVPACSAATSPPDLDQTPIEDLDFNRYFLPNPSGWFEHSALCWTFEPVGSRAGFWNCLPSGPPASVSVEEWGGVVPNFPCTFNP